MPSPKKQTTPVRKGKANTIRLKLQENVEDLDEALEVIPFTYSITAYGADYPVDSLVRRMESGDIVIPRFSWEPDEDSAIVGFQREYVWPRPKADRFIESLLLGLPVPGWHIPSRTENRLSWSRPPQSAPLAEIANAQSRCSAPDGKQTPRPLQRRRDRRNLRRTFCKNEIAATQILGNSHEKPNSFLGRAASLLLISIRWNSGATGKDYAIAQ